MALAHNPKMEDSNNVICMHASHKPSMLLHTKKVWEEAFQQALGMKQ